MDSMAKKHSTTTTETVVRDPETGRPYTLRGAGALKGRLDLREDIDLTKPILAQVLRAPKERKRGSTRARD